jgi:acetyltransferase-like isoleucine patch superfamily enzyme
MDEIIDKYSTLPLISVITVVYNGVSMLEETILSVIHQTYPNLEYIVIDGGSVDGTKEIIERYASHISYWVSEPDRGIYDAMNKGIERSTGSHIIFLNCGDHFNNKDVFEKIVKTYGKELEDYDLVYGRAKIIKPDGALFDLTVYHSHNEMWKGPNFRHGALLVKSSILKEEKFELIPELKIAADFDFIYKCYKKGCSFYSIDIVILSFLEDGISADPYKHLKDNIYILKKYKDWNSRTKVHFLKKYIRLIVGRSFVRKILLGIRIFFQDYFSNYWINKIPFYFIRHWYYRNVMGIKIGKGSSIHLNCFVYGNNIEIAENAVINRRCNLDGRGRLYIGNNASISPDVHMITGDHDYNSVNFSFRSKDIYIDDYVWIGARATILPGVRLGRGAVICAGAVVTKDVEDFAVVAGIPAVKIRERNRNINYNPSWMGYFD